MVLPETPMMVVCGRILNFSLVAICNSRYSPLVNVQRTILHRRISNAINTSGSSEGIWAFCAVEQANKHRSGKGISQQRLLR